MIKINMTYDCVTLQKPLISAIIKRCVEATLMAEGISAPCEINVLVTNDKGIRAINQASRPNDAFSLDGSVIPAVISQGSSMDQADTGVGAFK